jgi:hypothetical protein
MSKSVDVLADTDKPHAFGVQVAPVPKSYSSRHGEILARLFLDVFHRVFFVARFVVFPVELAISAFVRHPASRL